jgi:hypothetical protein
MFYFLNSSFYIKVKNFFFVAKVVSTERCGFEISTCSCIAFEKNNLSATQAPASKYEKQKC